MHLISFRLVSMIHNMKNLKRLATLIFISISFSSNAQVSAVNGLYLAKEFSKEIALYKAKEFVINEIIGIDSNVTQFEMDALAATASGELTSLVYRCDEKQLSGLVLGFFGSKWNDAGVSYQAFAFKNIPQEVAIELLKKLTTTIEGNSKYLNENTDNNIVFRFKEFTFLIYNVEYRSRIRIFWNDFDSEWQSVAFERTRKRFERYLNN